MIVDTNNYHLSCSHIVLKVKIAVKHIDDPQVCMCAPCQSIYCIIDVVHVSVIFEKITNSITFLNLKSICMIFLILRSLMVN